METTEKYELFKQSFYYGFFLHIPAPIICSALEEVYRNIKRERFSCNNLFDELFELEASLFLNTFFGASELSYLDNNGSVVSLKSLATSGAKASVKRDSVDSSISREYFAPAFLPGEEPSDFPLGYIKKRIIELKDECSQANSFTMGIGANIPCGADLCKYIPAPTLNKSTKCKGCR